MGTRLEFQDVLEALDSSVNVYFQPPANVTMSYPAIVYNRDLEAVQFADNGPYSRTVRYQVIVIGQDPDSPIPGKVAALPLSRFVRHFTTESLNHDIYDVYF
jgi:hypothetical protein